MMTAFSADTLVAACAWIMVLWSAVRVVYMSAETPWLDRIGVATLGGAALPHALPHPVSWYDPVSDVLLWLGVVIWVVTPSLRCWLQRVGAPQWLRRAAGARPEG